MSLTRCSESCFCQSCKSHLSHLSHLSHDEALQMVGRRALLPVMHAGGRLLSTSQQGEQGVHIFSVVLMQRRRASVPPAKHSPQRLAASGVKASSSWLQECKQLQESMRKCVVVPPASLLPAPPLICRQALGRSARRCERPPAQRGSQNLVW